MYDLWLSKSRSHRHCVRQITVIGGTRYFTTTKSKWKTAFCVPLLKNFREQRNIWKGGPVFPDEIFQTVRGLQSAFSPKTRLVLISYSAIANHDVIITINFAKKNKRLREIYPIQTEIRAPFVKTYLWWEHAWGRCAVARFVRSVVSVPLRQF